MKMGLNEVEVSPHGLIFDEDEATGCPMPLEALPTLFKVVLSTCWLIFDQNSDTPDFSSFFVFLYTLLEGTPLFGVPRWIHLSMVQIWE